MSSGREGLKTPHPMSPPSLSEPVGVEPPPRDASVYTKLRGSWASGRVGTRRRPGGSEETAGKGGKAEGGEETAHVLPAAGAVLKFLAQNR